MKRIQSRLECTYIETYSDRVWKSSISSPRSVLYYGACASVSCICERFLCLSITLIASFKMRRALRSLPRQLTPNLTLHYCASCHVDWELEQYHCCNCFHSDRNVRKQTFRWVYRVASQLWLPKKPWILNSNTKQTPEPAIFSIFNSWSKHNFYSNITYSKITYTQIPIWKHTNHKSIHLMHILSIQLLILQ